MSTEEFNIAHNITPKCCFAFHFKFIKTLAVQIIQVADYQKINSIKSTLKKRGGVGWGDTNIKQLQNNENNKKGRFLKT